MDPIALSYGMGVDSTAVLVGWWRRGIRPHWIGHAQVGNEWPETYAYRPIMDAWLADVGFPTITDVQYVVQRPSTASRTGRQRVAGDIRVPSDHGCLAR